MLKRFISHKHNLLNREIDQSLCKIIILVKMSIIKLNLSTILSIHKIYWGKSVSIQIEENHFQDLLTLFKESKDMWQNFTEEIVDDLAQIDYSDMYGPKRDHVKDQLVVLAVLFKLMNDA